MQDMKVPPLTHAQHVLRENSDQVGQFIQHAPIAELVFTCLTRVLLDVLRVKLESSKQWQAVQHHALIVLQENTHQHNLRINTQQGQVRAQPATLDRTAILMHLACHSANHVQLG